MLRKVCSLLPLLAVLGLTGCLDFTEQAITWRHDAKADTLRLFLDYRGIFGTANKDQLARSELDELTSVLQGQRAFFFANWILEYDRADLEEMLRLLREPGTPEEREFRDKAGPAVERLLKAALQQVRVETGPAYLDAEGRLCGVQRVTVQGVKELVRASNEAALVLWRGEAAKPDLAPAKRAALMQAVQDQVQLVRLEGNRLTFTFPFAEEEYEKAFGRQVEDPRQLQALQRAGARVEYQRGCAVLAVGSTTERTSTLTLPVSGEAYRTNALAAVRQRAPVLPKFDARAAAREFLEARGAR